MSSSVQNKQIVQFFGKLITRSGKPAAGVGVALFEKDTSDSSKPKALILGSNISDSNGTFIISLSKPTTDNDLQYFVELSFNEKPIQIKKPTNFPNLWGPHTFVVHHTPPAGYKATTTRRPLIASDEELVTAWKLNPEIFSRQKAVRASDPCSPSSGGVVPSRVFYFTQTILFPEQPDNNASTKAKNKTNPIKSLRSTSTSNVSGMMLDLTKLGFSSKMRFGLIMQYRQEWWDAGETLGNLLYSVPLAPCEETKIAVVDWRRTDYATQTTTLDEAHSQDSTIDRNMSVDETVILASDKSIHSTTGGGGWGLSIGPVSGGHSETAADVSEAIDSTNTATRKVNDHIHQVSNTTRNTRSFAVAEVTQTEESTVRTRVLRNHNHCHTVTFQYYEVLQNYLLSTKVHKLSPAALVPFEIMKFDKEKIDQYGYIIRRALIDTTLEEVVDNILLNTKEKQKLIDTTLPIVSTNPIPGDRVTGIRIKCYGTSNHGQDASASDLYIIVNDTSYFLNGSIRNYQYLSAHNFQSIASDDLEIIGFKLKGNPGSTDEQVMILSGLKIELQSNGNWTEVLYLPKLRLTSDEFHIERIGEIVGIGSRDHSAKGDLNRLIEHLNANAVYYTGEIISAGDSGILYLALNKLGLTDYVQPTVVGKIGNYLAFPLAKYDMLPAQYRKNVKSSDLDSVTGSDERLISLPTPGIFAESQLGSCSACERIDDTRFWDWQKSPCMDQAPDITPEMLASRYQNPANLINVIKSDLEPKDVQIPQLPEPMIKVGDATMAELVKGLDLPDTQGILDLVQGLSQIASDHSLEVFKEIWETYFGKRDKGTPGEGEGEGGTDGDPTSGSGISTMV